MRTTVESRWSLPLVFLMIILMAGSTCSAQQSSDQPTAVLVELFTSQGCSSCPPADAVLRKLVDQQPVKGATIIALSLHVDYWNHLGWRDPFSQAQFSQRQRDYARSFTSERIYTPQLVVDGVSEFVGSDLERATSAIQAAARFPKGSIEATAAFDSTDAYRVNIDYRVESVPLGITDPPVELMIAVVESGLSRLVGSGENRGRNLIHTSVVRHLERVRNFSSDSHSGRTVIDLEPSWDRSDLAMILFVQRRRDRQVMAVDLVRPAENARVE